MLISRVKSHQDDPTGCGASVSTVRSSYGQMVGGHRAPHVAYGCRALRSACRADTVAQGLRQRSRSASHSLRALTPPPSLGRFSVVSETCSTPNPTVARKTTHSAPSPYPPSRRHRAGSAASAQPPDAFDPPSAYRWQATTGSSRAGLAALLRRNGSFGASAPRRDILPDGLVAN